MSSTLYKDGGETLLGWNCFQKNQEFAKGIEIDESGYFISKSWWENKYTVALMSVGEKQHELVSPKEIIDNAIDIMIKDKVIFRDVDGRESIEYAGGQRAYELWASWVSDNNEFPKNAVLPILIERIMCQSDAQVMVGEGRSYAACFIEWVGKENEEVLDKCNQTAKYFKMAAECAFKMNEPKGGFIQDEQTTRKFAEPQVRKQIVPLIRKAKEYDAKAYELLKEIALKL